MNKRCLAITVRVLKVITYIVSFAIVLAGSVMSKGTILFMTSQIRPHKTILYCNKDLERDKQYQAEISTPEQVRQIFSLSLSLSGYRIFISLFFHFYSSMLLSLP